ncbi:MAG: sugar ABC transporter permease [Candidatus Limnocylindrales bacterium]
MSASTLPNDPRLIGEQPGLGGAIAGYRRRVRQGDIGQLPVVIGLILIWGIFFWASNGIFLKPENLVNLALQMAPVGTMAIGVVFVLLLGEIDLTIGIVSGVTSAIMAVVNVKMGLPGPVAVLAGLGSGVAIGLLQGLWITRFRIPSFVVTLAGLIGWEGALLFILGDTGTINIRDPFLVGFAGTFFNGIAAWGLGVLFVLYLAGSWLLTRRSRLAAGLGAEGAPALVIRITVVAIFVFVALFVLQQDRGLPLSLVLFVGVIVAMDYIVKRTRFGRMVFAVGGNAEAARRAGIPVDRVRVTVFVIASTMSAWGGVLAASRLLGVAQSTGSGPVLLSAIASAVIGGTSLFGGRGTVWAALLGILVIQSISNGMDLLSFDPAVKSMITGIVLLAAVTIDAVARRGRAAIR